MKLKHELWEEDGGASYTFCLAGPRGDGARSHLSPDAKLIWVVEAGSHFEAATAFYNYMGYGEYTTEHEWDYQPYPEEWAHE